MSTRPNMYQIVVARPLLKGISHIYGAQATSTSLNLNHFTLCLHKTVL
jgi:hypothetical protein